MCSSSVHHCKGHGHNFPSSCSFLEHPNPHIPRDLEQKECVLLNTKTLNWEVFWQPS